jgi:hypothetical protein
MVLPPLLIEFEVAAKLVMTGAVTVGVEVPVPEPPPLQPDTSIEMAANSTTAANPAQPCDKRSNHNPLIFVFIFMIIISFSSIAAC